jgi:hypothetical protein
VGEEKEPTLTRGRGAYHKPFEKVDSILSNDE